MCRPLPHLLPPSAHPATRSHADPTFGVGGYTRVTPAYSTSHTSGMTVTLQPDGRILVGSKIGSPNGSPNGMVTRLLPSGQPDPTFGTGGAARPSTTSTSTTG